MIWSQDGRPLKGMSGEYKKTDYKISTASNAVEEQLILYVEVACNTLFGCGKGGMINPPDVNRHFTVKTADIVIFRDDVFKLLMDFDVLIGLAKHLPDNGSEKFEVMYFANDLVNQCNPTSPESIVECHQRAEEFISQLSSTGPSKFDFTIHAIGNSHIDTAWLWPYAETKRKCARTFSTVLHLMDEYPDSLRFAVSQAQQLEWIRQDYPNLFERLQENAKEKGTFIPVGGCWVEMDGNIPSGESLVRQMFYGQKFFQQHFGRRCTEFWLPDTFGYPSQLPQLIEAAGMRRFVTQKLSWNLVNRFPNQTFWWQGLDGTKVLTHFPPADTYCSRVTVEEAVKIKQDFAEKGRSRSAMLLYGYGDGGGGPDERMMERLQRMKALPGIPKLQPSTPDEFFTEIERNDLQNLVTWSGELYLELHNGTYTTHSEVKAMNRLHEFLLRDCELLSAILWSNDKEGGGSSYRNFETEWKNVLLNQFHDVLPGTSIEDVYKDAMRLYEETQSTCEEYLRNPVELSDPKHGERLFLNSLPWPRQIAVMAEAGGSGRWMTLPPMSMTKQHEAKDCAIPDESKVQVFQIGDNIIMRNRFIMATISKHTGQVVSLLALKPGSPQEAIQMYDAIRPGQSANRFMIYDDVPLYWDAWDVMDYHLETGKPCEEILDPVNVINTQCGCAIQFSMKIGKDSRVTQTILCRPDFPYLKFDNTLDWRERHKLLKVEFPVNIRSNEATYEIQFGHIKRPAHRNTSWDSAKFEVCGHKWADISESGFGVALLNNCKYGHSCHDGVLSLSLARGSTAPDDSADKDSTIKFSYALMPHFGPLQRPETSDISVIQAAYEFNTPVRDIYLPPDIASIVSGRSLFTVDNPAVMIEAVKVAEDGKSIILRLYECHGGKAFAKLGSQFRIGKAYRCNLSEEPLDICTHTNHAVPLILKAFEIVTLCLKLAADELVI